MTGRNTPSDGVPDRDVWSYRVDPDRTDDNDSSGDLRVALPTEPPHLTPEAARALLRLLRTVAARREHTKQQEEG